jgi:hypothetical protein
MDEVLLAAVRRGFELPASRLVMEKAYSLIIVQHVFVLVSLVVRRQSRANEARQHTLTLARGEAN